MFTKTVNQGMDSEEFMKLVAAAMAQEPNIHIVISAFDGDDEGRQFYFERLPDGDQKEAMVALEQIMNDYATDMAKAP